MKPLAWREVVRKFHELGFGGPFRRGRHPIMRAPDGRRVALPGEHGRDVHVSLQLRMIRQAGITKEDWENA